MTNNGKQFEGGQLSSSEHSKFVKDQITNTSSDLIEITEDKLENILLKHLNKMNKVKGWQVPVTLFVTIVLVLLTSEFKTKFGITADVWQAVFILAAIISFIWSCRASYNSIVCSKSSTINYLIDEIKDKN